MKTVGTRAGVGVAEMAVLEALDTLGARPGRRYVQSARVLAVVEDSIGLAPGYGYDILVDLALPWKMPVPLVDGKGNFGSRGHDPPANARYTEARLSHAGQAVLAAERGDLAPVPVGLINGNTYRHGTRPPFRPQAIIAAVRRVIDKPGTSGRQLLEIAGLPDFMTGCTITGDLRALHAGRKAELLLHARITITDELSLAESREYRARPGRNRTVLVIDNFPPYVNIDDTASAIAARATRHDRDERYPELHRATRLPLAHLTDESRRGTYWLLCIPDAGADPEDVRDRLLGIYGVFDQISAALPRPLAPMIKEWVAAHQDEDLRTSLTILETAVTADRPSDGT
jgi:DNA gyrase/topoisomerase IV subunit A